MTEPAFLTTTRASYDVVATDAAERWKDELAGQPLDRAVLAVFAELVLAGGGGPVADVGCGTGRVTGHLHGLGLDVFGIDLSPGMLAIARSDHPGLRFDVGSMTALDVPDAALAGVMAYYSTIHVPDDLLPQVFAEFHRVLAPGGHALLAFQVGDEPLHMSEAWGHEIALVFHRRRPEHVSALLAAAGLPVHAHAVRQANAGERTPHAYLLARKAAAGG
ncbi:class I SAM-dependent DNA methyltransferase [Pseudonocardia adelaidensis]|uniref:Class I SAM-dependent methyltransferase n=1 Tax=Pseudonocardia adelaidensis TaxID=648754 RepID=A0ABP9NGD3_9PSEU